MNRRRAAESRGRRAETLAAWWLRCHGWRIIARRVRTPRGEIDLVARRWHTLAFVEVKARRTAEELDDAIDAWRFRRIAAAAETLVGRYARRGETLRFDLILIAPGRLPRHLTNVWQG